MKPRQVKQRLVLRKDKQNWGFPGGSVKNPPVNAGDTAPTPDPGRKHTPRSSKDHVPQLLSLCWRNQKPQLLSPQAPEPVLWEKPPQLE